MFNEEFLYSFSQWIKMAKEAVSNLVEMLNNIQKRNEREKKSGGTFKYSEVFKSWSNNRRIYSTKPNSRPTTYKQYFTHKRVQARSRQPSRFSDRQRHRNRSQEGQAQQA